MKKFHISMFLTEDQMYWLVNYLLTHKSRENYYKEFSEIILKAYLAEMYSEDMLEIDEQ